MSSPNAPPTVMRHAVRSALAPMNVEPRISSPLTSQLLAGEVVIVIETRGDWLHVRSDDGYEGWTHSGYLTPSMGSESSWPISLGCVVRDVAGVTCALPLGARVGPGAEVLSGETLAADERAARFPLAHAAIAASASTLYSGASYLWGGVSPWGCDCSGFVQRIYALHGLPLPRDAWQQATTGIGVDGDAGAEHGEGDLLFFTDREDRRVTHVGIALGAGRMAHSSLTRGGVAVEQMNSDDAYVARLRVGFVDARRVTTNIEGRSRRNAPPETGGWRPIAEASRQP